MARMRWIKPTFFVSDQVAEVSRDARLMFIGLWCFSDCRGVHQESAKLLKREIFAGDDLTADAVAGLLEELIEVGLVARFEAKDQRGNNARWLYVTGWKQHQKPRKPYCPFPPPPGWRERKAGADPVPHQCGTGADPVQGENENENENDNENENGGERRAARSGARAARAPAARKRKAPKVGKTRLPPDWQLGEPERAYAEQIGFSDARSRQPRSGSGPTGWRAQRRPR